jgi:hypothetical protein
VSVVLYVIKNHSFDIGLDNVYFFKLLRQCTREMGRFFKPFKTLAVRALSADINTRAVLSCSYTAFVHSGPRPLGKS